MRRYKPFGGIEFKDKTLRVDERGYFAELSRESDYPVRFVQDNISYSNEGVIRGLHYQVNKPQAKLINVINGVIWDVVVDLRMDSKYFGDHFIVELDNTMTLFVPDGFAHGFQALTQEVTVLYKCSDYYSPEDERTLYYDDPELGIEWRDLSKFHRPPLWSLLDGTKYTPPKYGEIVSEKDLKGKMFIDCDKF